MEGNPEHEEKVGLLGTGWVVVELTTGSETMSEEILPLKPEELLSQGAFLTRLARDPVGDDHHAEDLVISAPQASNELFIDLIPLP